MVLPAAAKGLPSYPLLALAMGTGCRQGELLALAWEHLDLKAGTLTVKQSLSWTKADGFLVKPPKTKAARRALALPSFAVEALREHRTAQLKAG
jgi:integrase